MQMKYQQAPDCKPNCIILPQKQWNKGINFAKLHDAGIDLIVSKVEIDYKYPLRSMDRFIVTVDIQREGNVRLAFIQNIYRIPDNKLVAHGKITGVATKKGKPVTPVNLIELLGL